MTDRYNPEPVAGLPEIYAVTRADYWIVVVHSDYEDNGWIYLSYSARTADGQGYVEVMRARLDAEGSTLTDQGNPIFQGRARFKTPGITSATASSLTTTVICSSPSATVVLMNTAQAAGSLRAVKYTRLHDEWSYTRRQSVLWVTMKLR